MPGEVLVVMDRDLIEVTMVEESIVAALAEEVYELTLEGFVNIGSALPVGDEDGQFLRWNGTLSRWEMTGPTVEVQALRLEPTATPPEALPGVLYYDLNTQRFMGCTED